MPNPCAESVHHRPREEAHPLGFTRSATSTGRLVRLDASPHQLVSGRGTSRVGCEKKDLTMAPPFPSPNPLGQAAGPCCEPAVITNDLTRA